MQSSWVGVFLVISVAAAAVAPVPCQSGNPVAIPFQLRTPASGVHLTGGVLKRVYDNNVRYLLGNFAEDDLLYVFRERAGRQNPPGRPFNWDKGGPKVTGSVAGLFLMGSGNALRWEENQELRRRMNALVAGIDTCRQSDGFLMAYPEKDTALRENANYVRSWITHGLIDTAVAGNGRALQLIREHLDWFNHCEYLSQVVDKKRGFIPDHWIPYQGMISSTRMYLSPLGKADDLNLILDHYQEDWWLEQLLAGDDKAIYDRPESHCYEITAFEAYLDLYRITGEVKYLQAVLNAWEMLRDKWEMPGGSWALCERRRYPPKSYQLGAHSRSGELCCAVFWVKLNQRLHLLFPENEKFVNEIEKSIYNASIGNQVKDSGISYHTVLDGKKDEPISPPQGTCCEGQGTRLYGSLPEYLYSLSPAGIYVDMYAPSEISWQRGDTRLKLITMTQLPEVGNVTLRVESASPVTFRLSLRIPSWTTRAPEICLNGKAFYAGIPGSYCHIEREWKAGDQVSFNLAMEFRMNRYEGYDQVPGYSRYSLEYGPLLLGLTGKSNFENTIRILNDPSQPGKWLIPVEGKPLHFQIGIEKGYWGLREDEAWSSKAFEYMPYYDIAVGQEFTAFPVVQNGPGTYK
ncbi:MAG TPA: beta-L-arabinofuranosidase domain-containing protein [Acidobacteriota bacterium]|nr:beta-L-arabinofuranosidase domain-containing protein [Acidobacteriota bacterium]